MHRLGCRVATNAHSVLCLVHAAAASDAHAARLGLLDVSASLSKNKKANPFIQHP